MLARRLLILLAVLMGLTALAAGVAPREPARDTAAEPPAPAAAPVEDPLERTLSADGGPDRRVVARRGRVVRLTVEGDVVDSVVLGDLKIEPIDPESPALFELLVDELGTYPITLLDAGRRIGVLEVEE